MIEPSEAVDVSHHARWAMENLKEVSKKLLGPAADLMDGPVIFQNFFDGAAVAEPIEFCAPEEFPILANSPAPAASFAHKRMVVAFPFSAAAGAESDRAQARTVHSEVKGANAVGPKEGKRNFGSLRIVGLHEDPAHAGTRPICLKKARE